VGDGHLVAVAALVAEAVRLTIRHLDADAVADDGRGVREDARRRHLVVELLGLVGRAELVLDGLGQSVPPEGHVAELGTVPRVVDETTAGDTETLEELVARDGLEHERHCRPPSQRYQRPRCIAAQVV